MTEIKVGTRFHSFDFDGSLQTFEVVKRGPKETTVKNVNCPEHRGISYRNDQLGASLERLGNFFPEQLDAARDKRIAQILSRRDNPAYSQHPSAIERQDQEIAKMKAASL